MAVKLKPDPIHWTLSDRWQPESTVRDGLRFIIRHNRYGDRLTLVVIERASDGLHFESIGVGNTQEAENVVRTWDLEKWRSKAEKSALEAADQALSAHRHAMTRLNEVRAIRV